MDQQIATQIKKLVSDFLSQLGFAKDCSVSVDFDDDSKYYQIQIQTEEESLLVGYRGDTLAALQLLVSQHLNAQTGNWYNLNINVNDYRQRREESVYALADTAVSQAVSTGQPQILPPLPPNERRLVHVYLADNSEVTTESHGEGRSRSVIVSPKK